MKKILTISIVTTMVVTVLSAQPVQATNFEGQEDKYMTLCTSNNLSNNDVEVCREFNSYLKDKNKALKGTINENKDTANETKNNLSEVESALETINQEIGQKESELDYLNTSIETLENDISIKEEEVKERMYAMQSQVNSNMYITFIFSASDFTDMFSRINNLSELTSYDKELILSLHLDREELAKQQQTVVDAKANLDDKKSTQEVLQSDYLTLYNEQNAEIIAQEKEVLLNNSNSQEIDDHLAAMAAASKESQVGGITEATPPPTTTNPGNNGNGNSGGNSGNDNNGGNNNGGGTTTPPVTGDSAVGLAIANAALSKQGSPYGWGHNGPNSFDCSGLVYWAHNQAGISLGRTTAAGYSGAGKSVSYSNLQAGDVVTFKTDPSYVSHIGIYIGNGMMVHAPTFNMPVQVANINTSYWQSVYYNARRLY